MAKQLAKLAQENVDNFVHSLGNVIEPLADLQSRILRNAELTEGDRDSIHEAIDNLSTLGRIMRSIEAAAIKDDRAAMRFTGLENENQLMSVESDLFANPNS